MCRDLRALREAIVAYATGFDASLLGRAEAGEVVTHCTRIEASIASLKALAAARAAEAGSWRRDGYRSAADELAHKTKTSPSAAKRALETGRRLADQPEVAKAALAGELSPEQAALVAEGVEADPGTAAQLVAHAQQSSLSELNEEVARIKAAVSDSEARQRAIHAKRSFRRWRDRDGALQAHLYGQVEDGVSMWRLLDPIRRRLAGLRAEKGLREPFEALDYDALMAIAEIASGRDGELSLADLLDLGLFPQLEAETLSGGGTDPHECDEPATDGPPATSGPPAPAGPSAPSGPSAPAGQCAPWGPSAPPGPSGVASQAPPAPASSGPEAAEPPGKGHRSGPCVPMQRDGVADPGLCSLFDDFDAEIGVELCDELHAQPSAPATDAPATDGPATDRPGTYGPPTDEPATDGPESGVPPGAGTGAGGPVSPDKPPRRVRKLVGSPTEIMVRVDLDTLLRGVAIEGELCEIAGYGPVPVSVIKDLAANDNAVVVGMLTKSKELIGVYHHRRHPNAYQASALRFVYPSCAVAGCGARVGLQADHREDWARTHFTVFDLLDRLCTHHHRLKTNHGWALVKGSGKRAFVPPDDPRHPAGREASLRRPSRRDRADLTEP